MTSPQVMRCDNCGAPLQWGSPFCGYCRTHQVWSSLPDLQPGAAIASWDFRVDALPGTVSSPNAEQVSDGTRIKLEPRAMNSGELPVRLRDGRVLLQGVCYEPHAALGVLARINNTGGFRCAYAVTARPALRTVQIARLVWGGGRTETEVLRKWEHTPASAGPGQSERLELRFADAILQVRLNDQPVVTVLDSAVCFGAVGWRVSSYGGHAAVLLQRLEVGALG